MPSDEKIKSGDNSFFKRGIVVSFDLVTADLKKYYSETSPQGAYEVIARAFKKQGFEKLKDSDYRHDTMNKKEAAKFIADFSEKEKWFPASVGKLIISPNVPRLDISDTVKQVFADRDWINEKDKEYAAKQALKESGAKEGEAKQSSLADWKSEIDKEKAKSNIDIKPDNGKIHIKSAKEH